MPNAYQRPDSTNLSGGVNYVGDSLRLSGTFVCHLSSTGGGTTESICLQIGYSGHDVQLNSTQLNRELRTQVSDTSKSAS